MPLHQMRAERLGTDGRIYEIDLRFPVLDPDFYIYVWSRRLKLSDTCIPPLIARRGKLPVDYAASFIVFQIR